MSSDRENAPAERERTDQSLRGEREKTDDELAKRVARLREDADDVLQTARSRADAVLERARERADEAHLRSGASPADAERVDRERGEADAVLRAERAAEDTRVSEERDERRRVLTALLALERAQTDHDLRAERGRTDDMISSRNDVLAVVSHELRNLLGGMALSAGVLRRIDADGPVRDAVDREASRIERYTARMTRLVGDLLDVVSIEAGRLAVVPDRHDAKELLREALDVFRPLAAAKQISMEADVHAGSVLARYDYERVLQVLANLLGNAIKFTPEGGRIDVVVEAAGSDVRFAVRDTGPGIEPDELRVVFDRFRRLDAGGTKGLGLGLYISKCIVEAHGGKMWAESRVGEGSTFFFTLPGARSE